MSTEEAIYIGDGDKKLMNIETARNLYLKGEIQLKQTFICSEKNCNGTISCRAFSIDSKKKYHFATYGKHCCREQSEKANKQIESDTKINEESKVGSRIIKFEPDFKDEEKSKTENVSGDKVNVENVSYKNTLPGEAKPYEHHGKYTTIKRLVNLFINDRKIEVEVSNKQFKITEFVLELNANNIMSELANINDSSGNIENPLNKVFYLKGKIIKTKENYVVFSNEDVIHEGKKKKISIYIDAKILSGNKKVAENKEYTFYCCEGVTVSEDFMTIFVNNSNKIYIK